eukprot:scaffold705_cov402-Prasinococcus_capsulatus_cf.AAC.3
MRAPGCPGARPPRLARAPGQPPLGAVGPNGTEHPAIQLPTLAAGPEEVGLLPEFPLLPRYLQVRQVPQLECHLLLTLSVPAESAVPAVGAPPPRGSHAL